ncbi:hypothetical protein ACSBR2_015677 [Camellia fascicularis]
MATNSATTAEPPLFPPGSSSLAVSPTSSTVSLRSGAFDRLRFRFSILNSPKLRRRLIGGNHRFGRCSGRRRARNAKKREKMEN